MTDLEIIIYFFPTIFYLSFKLKKVQSIIAINVININCSFDCSIIFIY